MLKRFAYEGMTPDWPLTLSLAQNVWPTANGFRPASQFSPITPAITGILGGASYIGSDGTSVMLGGTATGLYAFASTWTLKLGSLSASTWRFSQFDDLIIGVNGGAPVKYDIITGTAAALGGSPPTSDVVATVRDQVFLAGDPTANNALTISGYLDAEVWTPGTNQSLVVSFKSGGEIMGLAGGETGLILQKRAIRRAIYTGDVTVWQFDEIAQNVGCMAKGSVASYGDLVFFLSEQGFKMTDRNTITPIGQEVVDREFFAAYSRQDIENISSAIDPRNTAVFWAMPGNPGRIWAFNWTLNKWSVIDIPLTTVFSGFSANVSLEDIDTLFPSGLESVDTSLDAPKFAGGNPLFLIADRDGRVGAMSGASLAARFIFPPLEVEPTSRVRIRFARPLSDAINGTVTIDYRARAGDMADYQVSGTVRANGTVPLRANGRHIGIMHDIPAGEDWSYALGIELEYEREGTR